VVGIVGAHKYSKNARNPSIMKKQISQMFLFVFQFIGMPVFSDSSNHIWIIELANMFPIKPTVIPTMIAYIVH